MQLWMRLARLVVCCFLMTLGQGASAQIAAINTALIEDRQTITVFFDKPQTFTAKTLQQQFFIEHAYDYEDAAQITRKKLDSGRWHLSKDGYQLSYYPVAIGSYRVVKQEYSDANYGDVTYAYVGKTSEAVNILGRGPVLPINQGSLPIEAIGTKEVDIEFFNLTNPALLFERYYIGATMDRWDLDGISRNLTPAGIFRYVLPNNVNPELKSEHRIPIDKNITAGAYIVTVSPAGQIDKRLDTRVLFISDIGLHVRRYDNKTLVMANYFSTTLPVEEAKLEIWSNKGNSLNIQEEACQFEDGLCLIDRVLGLDEIVVVKKDHDISLLPMRELALDLNDFAVTGMPYQAQAAHVYSNRQLYRPGEPMTVNVLLRDDDGTKVADQALEIKLIGPDGKAVITDNITAEQAGFYQTLLQTQADAKTGNWVVEVRTDPHQKIPNGTLPLHIEEFMPERMELLLAPSQEQLAIDEALKVAINSRYLFGASASGNTVATKVNLTNSHTPFLGHKDWYVGLQQYQESIIGVRQLAYDNKLDDTGAFTQIITIPQEQSQPLSQVIRAHGVVNVFDGATSGISRDFTADFWPQNIVPVIQPHFKQVDLGYGQKADFELFAVDRSGTRVARELKLTLKYKSDWCTWVYSERNGWDCHRNDGYEIHELKSLDAKQAGHSYQVDPQSWGSYRLLLTDVATGFETEYDFRSSWSSSETGQLPVAKPLALNLTTDKPKYHDGEDMEVVVDAPFDGYFTLLVESDRLLFDHAFAVKKGKNGITVKLHPQWKRHDLYLSGLLIGKNAKNEVQRALGLIPINYERSARKLDVALNYPTITRPEAPFTVKLKVANPKANEPLFATVSVTDQGILNMTPTAPVDIIDAFFKHKKYGADIIDYYNRLFRTSSKALLTPKFGGDGEVDSGGNESNLTEMKTVTLTSNLLSLNKKGEATVSFVLPDFNGEAKIVAKVFSATKVGEVADQVVIRAPIVADLITPKFIRVGDKAHAALSLHNLSGAKDTVRVRISSKAFGVHFDQSITLEDQQSHNGLIPITLENYSNKAEVMMHIQSKAFNTERSYRIGTIPLGDKTAEYARVLLAKNQPWQRDQALSGNYDRDYHETLLVSRHPIINVLSYTSNLFNYPYGCTEQTTSAAFPWLFKAHPVLDAEKHLVYDEYRLGVEAAKNYTPLLSYEAWETKLMKEAIGRILDRQVQNGGFSLWSSYHSNIAISAYVADFLTQAARKYPQAVPSNTLDKVYAHLKQTLVSMNKKLENSTRYESHGELNDISYAAWVLAREGKIFSADLLKLTEIADEMSPLSRMYLAGANFVLGNERDGLMLMDKLSFKDWKGRYGYFYTGIAETALAIDLINQLKAKNLYQDNAQKAQDFYYVLNEKLKARKYFSTQERYALVKIGIDVPTDAQPINVLINGKKQQLVGNTAFDATTVSALTSDEPLFVEYQIEGYPNKRHSVQNFDASITRHYSGLTGDTVATGSRYLVVIEVTPERDLPNALLVDQIPGGFSLVNPNLLGGDVDEYYASFGAKARTTNLIHEEFRFNSYIASLAMKANKSYRFMYVIEAQIPGTYEIPSLTLEDMYVPTLRNVESFGGTISIQPIQ